MTIDEQMQAAKQAYLETVVEEERLLAEQAWLEGAAAVVGILNGLRGAE